MTLISAATLTPTPSEVTEAHKLARALGAFCLIVPGDESPAPHHPQCRSIAEALARSRASAIAAAKGVAQARASNWAKKAARDGDDRAAAFAEEGLAMADAIGSLTTF